MVNLKKEVIISHPIMVSDTVERKFSKAEEGPELEKVKEKKTGSGVGLRIRTNDNSF